VRQKGGVAGFFFASSALDDPGPAKCAQR